MGAGLETFLTVFVPIALVVGGGIYVFREQFRRLGKTVEAWKRRDEAMDLEEARCREKAEAELSDEELLSIETLKNERH